MSFRLKSNNNRIGIESSNFKENNCVICLGDFSTRTEKATIVTKGIPSLIDVYKIRGNIRLQDHLERQNEQERVDRVLVRPKCCHAYVDPKPAKRSSDSAAQLSPKKSKPRFNQPSF